jgi:hypothetical protein
VQDTEGHNAGPVNQPIKNYTGQTSILKNMEQTTCSQSGKENIESVRKLMSIKEQIKVTANSLLLKFVIL